MKNLITKYFKSPKGLYAMCIISLTESIFFIIPPDPFLALICIGKKFKKIFYPFFLCTIFSVIGGCIAYYLGDQIVDISKETNFKFITNNLENIEELKLKINNQTFSMMLTSAFTPLPFKIFCISAGIMNVNFMDFLLGSIVGRGSRFFRNVFIDLTDSRFNSTSSTLTAPLINKSSFIFSNDSVSRAASVKLIDCSA